MAESALENTIVKLRLVRSIGSKPGVAQTEFAGQTEGLYSGQIPEDNGVVPVSITLSYIADGAGDVRKIKYRIDGSSMQNKCGSFELRRNGKDLIMLKHRGLAPRHLVQEYACSITHNCDDAKIVEQLEKILVAVREYRE